MENNRQVQDRIVELFTREQFKLFLKDNPYTIVKASATWCGPCKRSTPFFMKIFNENVPKHIKLVKLDVDEGDDLASYLRIKSMPTYIHFFEGEPKEIYSSGDKDAIVNFFKSILRYY